MNRLIYIICFFFLQDTLVAKMIPKNLLANKTKSFILYSASHPMHNWKGLNKNIDCIIIYNDSSKTISKTAVSCKVAEFNSQNDNRDSHALEILESIKFPKITFVTTEITKEIAQLKIKGTLTFHGITKEISFPANYKIDDTEIEVKGKFNINTFDYNIELPSFMMIATDPNIKIDIEMYFNNTK